MSSMWDLLSGPVVLAGDLEFGRDSPRSAGMPLRCLWNNAGSSIAGHSGVLGRRPAVGGGSCVAPGSGEPRPERSSVRARKGEAGIGEHGARDQGEPADPHRHCPAADHRLPPEDDPQ